MLKLGEILRGKTYRVYHGTGVDFKQFDREFTSMAGAFWFTSDKSKILNKAAGASTHGYIITADVTINKPAGWDEYDKYSVGELEGRGFDGVILPDSSKQTTLEPFDMFVWDTKQIRIINKQPV